MGASGIQIATPFVVTEECDASQVYKDTYLQCKKEDIILVKSPVGLPGRAIKNKFMDLVKEKGRIAPKQCYQCMERCNPKETVYCISQGLINAVTGKVDDALLFCGADAWKYNEMTTVKGVLQRYIK
jgi:nitronate monooxygenase